MKVVVAGCGFVGGVLAEILAKHEHEVIGLTLSGSADTIVCDISSQESVAALAAEIGRVDAVVHCASSGRGGDRTERYRKVYLNGCENFLEHFPKTRLIFTSSTSVYPQTDGSTVTEESPAQPSNETSTILREAEELALGSSEGTVARLAGIYGPGRSFLLKRFLEGEAKIDGRWINQIHYRDAASALAFLLEQPTACGIYNVADDTPLWRLNGYEGLSKRFDRPMPPEGTPDPNRKRGWSNKRVSNHKLRKLGWRPKYPSYFDALDKDVKLIPSITG